MFVYFVKEFGRNQINLVLAFYVGPGKNHLYDMRNAKAVILNEAEARDERRNGEEKRKERILGYLEVISRFSF